MTKEDLIGYKYCVVWDDVEEEEYTIVNREAGDTDKNEISYNCDLVASLSRHNEGDSFDQNGSKCQIKKIISPNDRWLEFCKNKKIKFLYHFTKVTNIESIMQHGILSVNKLTEKRIVFYKNDPNRFDNKLDYISCSISYPNARMLSKYKVQEKYAILEIPIEIIRNKWVLCCPTNAATEMGKNIKNIEHIHKLFDRASWYLPSECTTDEQAELLVKDEIEPKHITRIYFECDDDSLPFRQKYNTYVNPLLFYYRASLLNHKSRITHSKSNKFYYH